MSDESDDDFVSYGTSLEPIEDEAARRKPVSLEDQVVTDKQGRRRFHGAFTGGFSAGYFNSVGTKEGWAPSTFVSSRGQRTGGQSRQRAEDFMDDEDLGDFGIAPRKVVTTDKFTGEEKTRKRLGPNAGANIPGESPLQDLIVPNNESMGARLLRKMGWRHGQGVGPKVRRRKKKSTISETDPKASQKGSHDDDIDDDDDSDFFYKEFLFAPTDVEEIAMKPKDDYHGIGYRGLDPAMAGMGQHVSLFEEQPVYNRSGRQGIAGQAFGIGAFEATDDDIYGIDSMSNYDRVMGGEDQGGGNYGWTAPKEHGKGSIGMLENFKASAQRRPPNKMFPPPVLPRDFRPFHTMDKPSKENRPPSTVVDFKSSRFTLSATQRGAMLGEEQLPGPSSVFDFLSPDDRQKLKSSIPQPSPSQPKEQHASKAIPGRFHQVPLSIPVAPTVSDPQLLQALGGGFKPFASDAAKQQRYEEYLARKRSGKASDVVAPSGSLTEWERQRETEEFVRASSLYQPLSGLMATRFVSAKTRDDEETVDVPAEEGGDKSDQAKAAEMKMFGKLTRDSLDWHPDNLLCKRFNIPNPYPGSTIVGLPTVKKDKFSVFNFLTIAPPAEELAPFPSSSSIGNTGHGTLRSQQQNEKLSRWDKKSALLANVGISDSKESLNAERISNSSERGDNAGVASPSETPLGHQPADAEPERESRPPMDLFKAIFANSSSSDDGDGDDEDEEEEEDVKMKENVSRQDHQEVTRHTTPSVPAEMPSADHSRTYGISTSNAVHAPCSTDSALGVLAPSLVSGSDADEMYGPSLPPIFSTVVHRDIGEVRGRNKRHDKPEGSERHASGERRRSQSHRKEKHRRKRESRSTSHCKRSKDKQHKSKKKKKVKESKVKHRGHHRSPRSDHRGRTQTASDVNYDASGSSNTSSSSDDSS